MPRSKRSTAHKHPSSTKQKRKALMEKRKRKEHLAFLQSLEKGPAKRAELLRKQRQEALRSRGKKGSHRRV